MRNALKTRLPLIVAALLVASAALFVIGVSAEKSEAGGESGSHSEEAESLLGINPESWALVGVGIAVSLLLAAGALFLNGRKRRQTLFGAITAFGIVFAAMDAREFVHLVSEDGGGLAVIAAVLVLLHLGVAGAAAQARAVEA